MYWQHSAKVTQRIADAPFVTKLNNLVPQVVRKELGLPEAAVGHTIGDGVYVWVANDLAKKFDLLPPQVEDAQKAVKAETEAFEKAAKAWDATARSLRAFPAELAEARAGLAAAREALAKAEAEAAGAGAVEGGAASGGPLTAAEAETRVKERQ
ncbi:hypothetical protein ADK38_16845, partial [Streptomyces varsoviensis]